MNHFTDGLALQGVLGYVKSLVLLFQHFKESVHFNKIPSALIISLECITIDFSYCMFFKKKKMLINKGKMPGSLPSPGKVKTL